MRDGNDRYDSGLSREVIRLAERMFEGDCSDKDRERLDSLVATSDGACRAYLEFVAMQFALFRLNTSAEPAVAVGEEMDDALGIEAIGPVIESNPSCLPAEPAGVHPRGELPPHLAPQKRRPGESPRQQISIWRREFRAVAGLVLGVAATLLFLGFGGMLQWSGPPQRQMAANRLGSYAPVSKIRFAVLKRSVNCQWGGAVPVGLATASDVEETNRVLTLKYGLAQFTAGEDVEVVVEGPAKLSFHDHDTIELLEGKLAVTVMEYGEPVRVLTPHGYIQVRAGGGIFADATTNNLEVQAAQKDAVVTWVAPHDVSHRHVVAAGAGVRIEPWSEKGGDVTEIAIDETRFVADLSHPFEPVSPPDLPVHCDLAFWYSADQNVRTDRQHRVVCWGDILFGENASADNAWQPLESRRPTIVENAINGRPAIRFDDRHQSLMSSEVALPDEQTIAMVFCARSPALESGIEWQNRHPDSAVATLVGPPGIVLGTDRETKLAQLTVGTRVLSGKGMGTMAWGFHRSRSVIDVDIPVAATIVYSSEKRNVRVFLNGHRAIDVEAKPGVASDRTNLCFGMNESGSSPFFGDLAEYIHFRRALSSDEVDDLHQYLGHRYSLTMASEGSSALP